MFIESTITTGEKILITMKDISAIREEKPEYPDFKTKYYVFVNRFSWCFNEENGSMIYEAWKTFLMEKI